MELAQPSFRSTQVNRLLLENPERVNLYLGTPADNTSDAQFPDAVLVWEARMDQRSTRAAVKQKASPTLLKRPPEPIPLQRDQLSGSSRNWEKTLMARHAREELTWEFVPLEKVKALAESAYQFDFWHRELYQQAQKCGLERASLKLLRYMQAHAHLFGDACGRWEFQSQTHVRKGSTLFVLGVAPAVDAVDEPGINTVVVMPHLSARGPHGFWAITRGRNHELVRLFEGCEAWILVGKNNKPYRVGWGGHAAKSFLDSIHTFEIFQTEADALEAIAEGGYCCPLGPDDIKNIRHLKAHELSGVLDGCDMLDGGLCCTVFSDKGRRLADIAGLTEDEFTFCTLNELAAMFRPTATGTSPGIVAVAESADMTALPLAA
jgi:hypothetical protein